MSEPISPERFADLIERAGLSRAKMGDERYEELRAGTRFLERMQKTVRRPRDRAAETSHIFVPMKG